MTYELRRIYNWKKFKLGELSNMIRNISQYFNVDIKEIDIHANYHSNDASENKELKIGEIGGISELGKNPDSLVLGFKDDNGYRNSIMLRGDDNTLRIILWAQNAELAANIISLLENNLTLEKFIEKEPDEDKYKVPQPSINVKKPDEIELKDLVGDEKLRCFISYRFNPKSKALVLELTRFLELLNVNVITGVGYEPRKVSEKVLSRLEDIDFAIYLVTDEGESTWIRDELAVSIGKGYNIIPLVENNAKLENGILGDWEYVPYESNHIGDTFISLIEAINFIRNNKTNE